MGRKVFTVLFDNKKASEIEVAKILLDELKILHCNLLTEESRKKIQEKIPSTSIYTLHISRPHWSNMQAIYLQTTHRGIFSLKTKEIAQKLSKGIPDVEFIELFFSSVVDTGNCSVYRNGNVIKQTTGKEGDMNKNIDPVFKKYFHIPKPTFQEILNWMDREWKYDPFIDGSLAYYEYFKNCQCEDDFIDKENKKIMDSFQLLKNGIKKETKLNRFYEEIAQELYEQYLYLQSHPEPFHVYLLTKGNRFSEEKCYFQQKPMKIEPHIWFEIQDKENKDYNIFKQRDPNKTELIEHQ